MGKMDRNGQRLTRRSGRNEKIVNQAKIGIDQGVTLEILARHPRGEGEDGERRLLTAVYDRKRIDKRGKGLTMRRRRNEEFVNRSRIGIDQGVIWKIPFQPWEA